MLEGLTPSVGSFGDALDNALAETTIGLYKTEAIRDGSPFRTGPITTLAGLEEITSAWVYWYNNQRLMHRLGRRPPAEAEAEYYAQIQASHPAVHTNRGVHETRGGSGWRYGARVATGQDVTCSDRSQGEGAEGAVSLDRRTSPHSQRLLVLPSLPPGVDGSQMRTRCDPTESFVHEAGYRVQHVPTLVIR